MSSKPVFGRSCVTCGNHQRCPPTRGPVFLLVDEVHRPQAFFTRMSAMSRQHRAAPLSTSAGQVLWRHQGRRRAAVRSSYRRGSSSSLLVVGVPHGRRLVPASRRWSPGPTPGERVVIRCRRCQAKARPRRTQSSCRSSGASLVVTTVFAWPSATITSGASPAAASAIRKRGRRNIKNTQPNKASDKPCGR